MTYAMKVLAESQGSYKPKTFDLSGLTGISDKTIEMHFSLYEGYVKNTNLLNERLAELIEDGQASGKDPVFAETTRRLGFEYNGMVLHEYYFENLTKNGESTPAKSVEAALSASYVDLDTWRRDFAAVGTMRGVGWAIAYYDPSTKRVTNHWITLHEDGHIAGYVPLLVMDVWEHAYLLDYKPDQRAKYVEAFFANVNWDVVAARLDATR